MKKSNFKSKTTKKLVTFLKRILLLSLILMFGFILLIAFLHISVIQNTVAQIVLNQIGNRIEREIQISRLKVSIFGVVEIKDFKLGNAPQYEDPLIEFERLYCTFSFKEIFKDKFKIKYMSIHNPKFRLSTDENHISNMNFNGKKKDKKHRDPEDDSKVKAVFERLEIEFLELQNGLFVFDYYPTDYHLRAKSIDISMEMNKSASEMIGKITTPNVLTWQSEKFQFNGFLNVTGNFWSDGVHSSEIKIESLDKKTEFLGECKLFKFTHPRLNFRGKLVSDLTQIKEIWNLSTEMHGHLEGNFEGSGLATNMTLNTDLTIENAQVDRAQIKSIHSKLYFQYPNIEITEIDGNLYEGKLEGSGNINVDSDSKNLIIESRLIRANLEKTMIDQNLPVAIPGTYSILAEIHVPELKSDNTKVIGKLFAEESVSESQWHHIIVDGDFYIENKTFKMKKADILSSDLTATMENFLANTNALSGNLNIHEFDIGKVLKRFGIYYQKNIDLPEIEGKVSGKMTVEGSPQNYVLKLDNINGQIWTSNLENHSIQLDGIIQPDFIKINKIMVAGPNVNTSGFFSLNLVNSVSIIDELSLKINDFDLSTIQYFYDLPFELQGHVFDGFMNLSFYSEKPMSTLLNVAKLEINSIPFGHGSISFSHSQNGFKGISIQTSLEKSVVSLKAELTKNSTPYWYLKITHYPLDKLAHMTQIPLNGLIELESESIDYEQAVFSISSPDLKIASESLGAFNSQAQLDNSFFKWQATIQSRNISSEGQIDLSNDILTSSLSLYSFPIRPIFASVLSQEQTQIFRGNITGNLNLSVDIKKPESLYLLAKIDSLDFSVNDYLFSLQSPTSFEMNNSEIQISDTQFKSDDSDFFVSGTVDLQNQIDIKTNGRIKMESLSKLTEIIENPKGRTVFDLHLEGSSKNPNIDGNITVEEFCFHEPIFGLWFEDFHGSINLRHKLATVEYFQGIAGGTFFSLIGDMGISKFLPNLLDLSIDANDIEFEFPEGFKCLGDIQINLTGDLDEPLIDGSVQINQALFNERINYKSMIVQESKNKLALKQREIEFTTKENPEFDPKLSIDVFADDNVIINNNLADIEMKLDMQVLGKVSKPSILGSIEAIDGKIVYQDRDFDLNRALITFSNPSEIDPIIDLSATGTIKEYEVKIEISGPLYRNFYVNFSSTPSLSDIDLFLLLATGKTKEQISENTVDILASTMAIVTGTIQDEIEKRFQYWMGFDEFSIDPVLSTTDENPSARFTVKKHLNPNLSVTYSRSISSTGDLLMVEYKVSDNLYLVGKKLEDDSVGGDIRFRWKFR